MATLDPRSALVHRLKFLSVVQELAKADFESAIDTVGLDSLEELSGGIGILPRDLQQQSSNRRDRRHTSPHGPLRDSSRYNSNQYNIRVNSSRYGAGSRIQLEDDDGDDYDEEGRYTGNVTKPHAFHLHTTERGRRVQPTERERGESQYVDAYTATSKPSIRTNNHQIHPPTGTTRAERLRQRAREDREYRVEMERRERAHGVHGAQEAGWDSRFFSLPARDAVDVRGRGSGLRRKPPTPLPARDIAEEDEGNMYAALPRTGSQPPPHRGKTRVLNSPLDPHAATYSGGGGAGETRSPASGATGRVLPRITFSSGDLAHANSTGALDSTFEGNETTTRYGAQQLPLPSQNLLPHPSMIRSVSNNELLQTSNSVNLGESTSGLNDTSRSCATPLGGNGVRLVRTSSRGPKAKPRTTSGGTPVNLPLSPAAVPDKVVDRVAQVMHNLGRQTDFSKLQSSNPKKDSTMENLKSAIDARIDNAVNEHMMEIRRSQQRNSSPDTNQSGSTQRSPFVGGGESFGHEGPTPTDGRQSSGIRAYSPTRQAIVSRDPPAHSAGQEAAEINPFGTYETIRTSDSPFEMEDEEGSGGDGSPSREKSQSLTHREYSSSNSPNRSSTIRRQQQHQREEISHLSDLLDQMLGDHAMVQLRSEKGLSRLLEGCNPDEQDEVDRARMMRLKRMQQELHGAMQKTEEIAEGDDRAAQAELELDRIRRQLVEQDKEELRVKKSGNQTPSSPQEAQALSKKRPATQRGFVPSSTVRAIQAAQAIQQEILRHNEDLWNSSSTSQYAFAARLTNVLIDDLVGELSVEMDSMLGEYVEGLAAHELQ